MSARLWRRIRRWGHLAWVAARFLLGHYLGRRARGPERLRRALESAGGTFIKLGQMLALQPDVVPRAYCNALFDLMDRVPPFGYPAVERIVREELGGSPAELFDSFERYPMASASIGQVHRARLDGVRVAVKVRRPTVDEDFGGDLWLLDLVQRVVRGVASERFRWVADTLEEFVTWTREELDYRTEARYMERLGENAADNPRERVPRLYWSHTGRRVLTAERLEGVTLLDHLRQIEASSPVDPDAVPAGFEPSAFAAHIIDNFLGDVFHHGVYHADLHPANLLVLPDNVVGYVDFGITGTLGRASRRRLVAMTLAYARADLDGLCDAFFRLAALGPTSDPEAFRREVAHRAEAWYDLTGSQVRLRQSFTRVMLEVTQLSHRTRIWPHREIAKYLRSVIALDGLIGRFAPDFDVGARLESFCRRALRRDVVREAISYERLAEGMLAGVHLLRDGLPRWLELLHRTDPPGTGAPPTPQARHALRYAALSLGLACGLALVEAPARLGFDPYTAATGVAVASLGLGLRALGRWARASSRVEERG